MFFRGGDFIKYIGFIVSLIPLPFLFHYGEIYHFSDRMPILFLGTMLLVILVGLLSTKLKFLYIVLAHSINIIVSIVLGTQLIIPPNSSWFNPLGMVPTILITGMIMLIGVLAMRHFTNVTLLKFSNKYNL